MPLFWKVAGAFEPSRGQPRLQADLRAARGPRPRGTFLVPRRDLFRGRVPRMPAFPRAAWPLAGALAAHPFTPPSSAHSRARVEQNFTRGGGLGSWKTGAQTPAPALVARRKLRRCPPAASSRSRARGRRRHTVGMFLSRTRDAGSGGSGGPNKTRDGFSRGLLIHVAPQAYSCSGIFFFFLFSSFFFPVASVSIINTCKGQEKNSPRLYVNTNSPNWSWSLIILRLS